LQNFSIMSEYVTEMGKIKHSRETGLRPRNQRKMAKAVRRAIGLGLIPSVYRHPQVLMMEPAYQRRMKGF
jgi:ribosomal protein S18